MAQQASVNELLELLDTDDKRMVAQVKSIILENLNNTREAWLLHSLVDHYINTKSVPCLDVLLNVREPHDKHLLDRFSEHMKSQNVETREKTLNFLGHLIRKHPSWLHKLIPHQLFMTLLKSLKMDVHVPVLLPGLLIVASLLPIVPALLAPYVYELFEIFGRLALWKNKKPGHVVDVHMLHLQIGLYALFQRLYGMYPCNFLAYLRSHFGTKNNNHLFNVCVKPYLERVRIHPLLVTASKEMEISATRWKAMEAHDIVVECASISLDALEATKEDSSNITFGLSKDISYKTSSSLESSHGPGTSPVHQKQIQDSFSIRKSNQFQSSGQQYQLPSDSCLQRLALASSEKLWTPYEPCERSTPTLHGLTHPTDSGLFTPVTQGTPRDSMVSEETAIEIIQNSSGGNSKTSRRTSLCTVDDQTVLSIDSGRSSEDPTSNKLLAQSIQEALDNTTDNTANNLTKVIEQLVEQELSPQGLKEREFIDKEVSDITEKSEVLQQALLSDSSSSVDSGQITPFLSTTKTLTGCSKVADIQVIDPSASICNSLQSTGADSANVNNYQSSLKDILDKVTLVSCANEQERPKLQEKRSRSLPNIANGITSRSELSQSQLLRARFQGQKNIAAGCYSFMSNFTSGQGYEEGTVEGAFESLFIGRRPVMPYEHLFATALPTAPVGQCFYCEDYNSIHDGSIRRSSCPTPALFGFSPEASYSESLSPMELLDRHLSQGSDIHAKEVVQIPLTSKESVHWTHFGGSPPVDEVNILRDQIFLLHSQLLYERHRRDMHAERNRRLFGKSKQASAYEEQTDAMKDQLKLQEQAMHAMASEMERFREENLSLQESVSSAKAASFDQSQCLSIKQEEFNKQNCSLQKSLDLFSDENGKQKLELKKLWAKLFDCENDVQFMQNQVTTNVSLKKEVARLNKELTLVGELQHKYQERLSTVGNCICHDDIHMDMCNKAAATDIAELKKALESITALDDAKRTRIIELEAIINKKELSMGELKKTLEIVKNQYHEQVQVTEEKYRSSIAVVQSLESHVLELYGRLECSGMNIGSTDKDQPLPSLDQTQHVQNSFPLLNNASPSKISSEPSISTS